MVHSVTTVGATDQIIEIAADFSGGGFSNYVRLLLSPALTHLMRVHQFQRPFWQEAAVAKFLAQLPNGTYAGLFNNTGRV